IAEMEANSLPAGYFSNNISVDPKFVDMANGDFQIEESSGCVDKGTATSPWETDYYGNPRKKGFAVDIGSHEFQPIPRGIVIIVR
ncbi:MAG: hypothetical protein JXN60_02240, partial [Lentisphaerae bacterium]|nr:hypothetical protein [Lentisphaerota bacterium]